MFKRHCLLILQNIIVEPIFQWLNLIHFLFVYDWFIDLYCPLLNPFKQIGTKHDNDNYLYEDSNKGTYFPSESVD